jgi:uncharacterized protein
MANYEFDADKDVKNIQKHGVSLEVGVLVFNTEFIEWQSKRKGAGETRFVAVAPVALLDDRYFAVVYTWRGIVRRFISVRRANVKEIARYRQSLGR